jgi:hypothetical protein
LEAQNEKEGCLDPQKASPFRQAALCFFLRQARGPVEAVMFGIITVIIVGAIVIAIVWSEEKKLRKQGKGSRFAALWRNNLKAEQDEAGSRFKD